MKTKFGKTEIAASIAAFALCCGAARADDGCASSAPSAGEIALADELAKAKVELNDEAGVEAFLKGHPQMVEVVVNEQIASSIQTAPVAGEGTVNGVREVFACEADAVKGGGFWKSLRKAILRTLHSALGAAKNAAIKEAKAQAINAITGKK